MIPLGTRRLKEILGIEVDRAEAADTAIRRVVTDSRRAGPGDIFVALRGERHDGHGFVAQALQQGAEAAVVERGHPLIEGLRADRFRLLQVSDTLQALGLLGRENRRRSTATFVAITGTCGKTTTKEWLAAALETTVRVVRADKSFNNAVGVPTTLLEADAATEVVVCEVGTNAPGEIAALTAMVEPDLAILTAIGPGHLEGLGSLEGVAREKADLFRGLARPGSTGFANANDPRVLEVARAFPGKVRLTGDHAESVLRGRVLSRDGADAVVWIGEEATGSSASARMPLLSERLLDDLLLALAAARHLGVPLERALPAIAAAILPGGRQRIERIGEITLIDDAYNANPLSMRAAFDALSALPGRRLACLGDMLELGSESARYHRELGPIAVGCGVEELVLVGRFAGEVKSGALEAGMHADRIEVVEPERAASALLRRVRRGDALLLKASRRIGLERLVEPLKRKFAGSARAGESDLYGGCSKPGAS